MENLKNLIKELFTSEQFIQAVACHPLIKNDSYKKIIIKTIKIKNQNTFQLSHYKGAQVFYKNIALEELLVLFPKIVEKHFKEVFLFTTSQDFHVLRSKHETFKILKKPPSLKKQEKDHNRSKNYLLNEIDHSPFWQALGIANQKGEILKEKRAKFRQVNKFLEIIKEILPELPQNKPLKIFDFGCGKAYLTFALYHYLTKEKNFSVVIQGVDLKQEVINLLEDLRKKLNYENLHFKTEDIEKCSLETDLDLVIALHACDTATDLLLYQAIKAKAKIILAVPCCQNELYKQLKTSNQTLSLQPVIKHGILKERLAALITDAARANLLEIMHYKVQVIEFIDLEYTSKNLLIKAILNPFQTKEKLLTTYQEFKNLFSIEPKLEKLLFFKTS